MNEDVERIKIEVDTDDAIRDLDKVEKKMEDSLGGKTAAKAAKKSSSDISGQYDKATKDITKYFDKSLKDIQRGFKDVNKNADDITKTLKSIKFAREVDIEAKKAASSIRKEFSSAIEEIESKANNAAASMGNKMANNLISAYHAVRDVWKNFSTLSLAVIPTVSPTDMNKMLFDKELEKAIRGVKGISAIKFKADVNAKQLGKEIKDAVSSIPNTIPMNIRSNFDQAQRDIARFRDSLDAEFTEALNIRVNMDNFNQAEKNIDVIASKLKDFDVVSGPVKKYADDLAEAFDIKDPAKYAEQLKKISYLFDMIYATFNASGDDFFPSKGFDITEENISTLVENADTVKKSIDDITRELNNLKHSDFGVTDNSIALKYIDTALELLGKIRPHINNIRKDIQGMNGDFSESSLKASKIYEHMDDLDSAMFMFNDTGDGLGIVANRLKEITEALAEVMEASGDTKASLDALEKSKGIFKNLWSTLGAGLGSTFGPLGSAAGAGLGTLFGEGLSEAGKEAIKDIQIDLVEVMREAARAAGEVDFTMASDSLLKGFATNDIMDILENDVFKALDELQRRIENSVDFSKVLRNSTDSTFSNVFKSDKMTIAGLKEYLRQMEEAIENTKNDLNEQLGSIGDPKVLQQRLEQHIENLKQSFTNVSGLDVDQFLDMGLDDFELADYLADVFDIPRDAAGNIAISVDYIREVIKYLDKIKGKDMNFFEGIEKSAKEQLDAATETIEQFKEKYMSLLEAISGVDIEGNKEFRRTMGDLGKGFTGAKANADALDKTLLRMNTRKMDLESLLKVNDAYVAIDENMEVVAKSIDDINKRIQAMSDEAVKMGFSLEEILSGSFEEGSAEAGIQRMIKDVLNNVKGELKDLSDEIGLDASAINSRLRERLFNMDGVTISGLDSIMKSMQDDLNSYMTMINADKHLVEEALGIDPNAVHPNMSDYWKWAHMRSVPTIASMISDITGSFRSMGSGIGNAMTSVTGVITSSISTISTASRPYLAMLGDTITSHISSIAGKLSQTRVGERICQTIGAGITRGQSYVSTATSKVTNTISGIINSASARFPNLASRLGSAFTTMTTMGANAANKIRTSFNNMAAPLRTLPGQVRRLTTALKNEFDASTAKGQQLRASLDNIKKGMEALTSIAGKVSDAFKGIFNATKNLVSNINLSKNATDGLNRSAKATHNTFSSLLSLITPYLSIFYIFQSIGKSIKLGIDATETEAMYQTVFKTSGALEEMNEYIDELVDTLGLSRTELQNNTATLYNFAKNIGLGNEEAVALSKDLVMLAQDMASFYNADPTEVFNNLKSALSGSAETVSKYGMNLYEANVKQYAYANGIAAVGTELTQGQKVMARYLLMMEQAGVAHGDLQRTLRSPANQLRMLKQDFAALGTTIGQAMQPILTIAIPALRQLVQYLTYGATKIKEFTYSLASLMGIDMNFGITGGVVNENASQLSDGYDDAADSIDGTTEAAKRLERQLSSADELNILSSNKDQMEIEKPEEIAEVVQDELSETESITQEFSNRFADIVATIFKTFKDGFNKYLPDLTESINQFKGAWQSMCNSLEWLLGSVWKHGGQEFVMHMGEIAASIAIAATEIGRGILDALGNLWDYLDPSNNPASREFIKHMNSLAKTVRDALNDIGDAFAEFMKHGGQDVLNTLVDTALTVASLFAQAAETIIEIARRIWEHISPKNNPATKNFLIAFKDLLFTVQDIATKITSSLDGFAKSEGMTFLQLLFDKFIKIGTAVTDVVTIIVREIEKLWNYLDPDSNPYVDKLVQSFMSLLDKFGELDDTFRRFLENGGSEFLQNIADIAAIIGSTLLDAISWLIDHLENLAPVLAKVSEIAKTVFEVIANNPKGILTLAGGFVAITAAINGLVAVGSGLGTLVQAVNGFISAGPLLKAAWGAITGFIGGISAPVVAIVAGIVAVVIAIKQLWSESDAFRNKWTEVWESVKSTFDSLWNNFLKPIIEDIKDAFSKLWNNALKPLWDQFKGVVEQLGMLIGDLLLIIMPVIEALIDLFGPALTTAIGTVIDVLVAGFTLITDVVGSLLDAIGGIVDGIESIFGGLIDFIAGVFTGDWERAWEGVKSVFVGIFETLGAVVKAPLNLLIDALNFCINALNSISIDIPDWEWIPDSLQGKSWGFNIPNIPKLAKGQNRIPAFVKSRKNGETLISKIFPKRKIQINNIISYVVRGRYCERNL